MKKLNTLFYLLIAFTLVSCGTVSNYSDNSLNKNYYQNKTLYFKLSPNSVKDIKMSGLYTSTIFDDNYPPNIESIFKESILELSSETKVDLKIVNDHVDLSGNETLVNVDIKNISWHFGISIATLKSQVLYEIQGVNKFYHVEGIRKSGGGSKINNVRKSIKNANYKFLKEFEK